MARRMRLGSALGLSRRAAILTRNVAISSARRSACLASARGVLLLWGEEPGVDAGLLGRRSLDVGAGGLGVVLLWVMRFVVHGRRVTGGGEWGLGAGVRVVGEGPFDRLRANGFWGARLRWGVGRRESEGGLWLGCPARRPSGYRLSPVWTVGGVRARGVLVTAVVGPASAGRALREAPLRRGVGRSGKRGRLVVGMPRPSPLWIPAFAGMTVGGARAGKCCWWLEGPSTGSGRTGLTMGSCVLP